MQPLQLRKLGKVYADLRRDDLNILRAADHLNFGERSLAIGHAWFAGLDDVIPQYARAMEFGTRHPDPRMAGWRVDGPPFEVNNPADLGHWVAVVSQRSRLQPVMDYADEALPRMSAANLRMSEQEPSAQPEQSSTARAYGGNEVREAQSPTARAIRSLGAAARAKAGFDVGFPA